MGSQEALNSGMGVISPSRLFPSRGQGNVTRTQSAKVKRRTTCPNPLWTSLTLTIAGVGSAAIVRGDF
jgi:hypothetical protein